MHIYLKKNDEYILKKNKSVHLELKKLTTPYIKHQILEK